MEKINEVDKLNKVDETPELDTWNKARDPRKLREFVLERLKLIDETTKTEGLSDVDGFELAA